MAQMVRTIPDEMISYIGFLHDVIAAYHERLSLAASPKVAGQFLVSIADKEIRALGLDKGADPKQMLDSMLRNLGMKYQTFKVGDQVVSKLECPHATAVHPRISAMHPICPVSILALGTERIRNKTMVIASNHLTRNGAQYTVAPSKST
jgi:hypothetical protein